MVKYFLIFYSIIIFGCTNNGCHETATDTGLPDSTELKTENAWHIADSVILTENFNKEDEIVNDHLKEELQPIRANFKRINSIKSWDSVVRKGLHQTTELGEATFYYLNGTLEKIVTRNFGETFQQLTEYYLMDNKLSFVFEKELWYNRPIDYDSADMRVNNDKQAFNFEMSEVFEDRSYFIDEKLIHQLNNQDCGFPFADDYLKKEETRIKKEFHKLLNQSN